jgi:hypothetical protein
VQLHVSSAPARGSSEPSRDFPADNAATKKTYIHKMNVAAVVVDATAVHLRQTGTPTRRRCYFFSIATWLAGPLLPTALVLAKSFFRRIWMIEPRGELLPSSRKTRMSVEI